MGNDRPGPIKAEDPGGAYTELPFQPAREVGMDTVRIGMHRHLIPIFAEVEVTAARTAIARRKAETGEGLSFTGWVITCLAQASSEHKRVHAVRLGLHKLLVFDDIDVKIVVQRRLQGSDPPEYLPMPYVIRKANEKTVEAIHAEIRAAQAKGFAPGEQPIDLAEKMPPLGRSGPSPGCPSSCGRRCTGAACSATRSA